LSANYAVKRKIRPRGQSKNNSRGAAVGGPLIVIRSIRIQRAVHVGKNKVDYALPP
jgi:hypothetical protein